MVKLWYRLVIPFFSSLLVGWLIFILSSPSLAGSRTAILPQSSTNAQWQPVGLPSSSVTTFAFDQKNPGTLYVVDQKINKGDVYSTTNGGATWQAMQSLNGAESSDTFAVDPTNSDILWAPGTHGVAKSINRGRTWVKYALAPNSHVAIVVDPTNPKIVLLGAMSGWGIYRTKAGGIPPWENVLFEVDVTSLALHPSNSQIIYVGTKTYNSRLGGVYKSTKGGDSNSWTKVFTDAHVSALVIDPIRPQVIYAGTNLNGIFKSIDGGATWNPVNNGLTYPYIRALAIHPTENDAIYAGTWEGGVFESVDGGGNWTAINAGLPHLYIAGLALDPTNPYILYAGVDNHQIYKTAILTASLPMTTVTPTVTPTATATRTPTSSATPTPTATPTATTTPIPPGQGDGYEQDDSCAQAQTIATDGNLQQHTFHKSGDVDWVTFTLEQGARYFVEGLVPTGSAADLLFELYDACTAGALPVEDTVLGSGFAFDFPAPQSGSYYLKVFNHDAPVAGATVRYELSVRKLGAISTNNVLILVAGHLKTNDEAAPFIYEVADRVYSTFRNHGYSDDRIYYLAADLQHPQVDASATVENLRQAIGDWAASRLGAEGTLNLYLVDHGERETFFLDKPAGQWVTPNQLHEWLAQLEATRPGLKVNLFIEACYSGSFISHPASLSKAERVIMTSTNDNYLAWTSQQGGAVFSNYLLTWLNRGSNLAFSFYQAQASAQAYSSQKPWLDADGNGVPNEPNDFRLASQRGFEQPGGLANLETPPIIAEVQWPTLAQPTLLRVRAVDDVTIAHVWAIRYAPGYIPPTTSEALIIDRGAPGVTEFELRAADGDGWYTAEGLTWVESGQHRLLLFAEDNQGLFSPPLVYEVTIQSVFLPVIQKQN